MTLPLVLKNEITPEIVCLTLNRPEKKKCSNTALLSLFLSHLNEIEKSNVYRVLILNGSGTTFVQGWIG